MDPHPESESAARPHLDEDQCLQELNHLLLKRPGHETPSSRGGDCNEVTADETSHISGNVSNAMVVPPDYQGTSSQKGHLVFDADFEHGNLGKVVCISDSEFDLYIRPDTCNSRYRIWFFFTVRNVFSGQKVVFNIINYSKSKSLFREGMSPVVSSSSRPKWERIPSRHVYYYRCPRHHQKYIMSFLFAFDCEADKYCFAYSFPYSYSDLQRYLEKMEKLQLPYVRRELLGCSLQLRKLDLITISSPENLRPGARKKVVFITARVHPGETPSSYVVQGMMDFLLNPHDARAQRLRDALVFCFVPMLNPDGVFHGNYRCSFMGFDLNRHWHQPLPCSHPTIVATKARLLELNADPLVDLDFFIDIHAHSTLTNVFVYGNDYADQQRLEKHRKFPKLLYKQIEDFSLDQTSYNKDAYKEGTGRRFLGQFLNPSSNCYTLEISFFSSFCVSSGQVFPYTAESYHALGKSVALTFLDYYELP
eukprot:Sdes_comp20961_c0_seq1m18721